MDSLAVLTWNVYVGGGDLVAFLAEELGFACGAPERRDSVLPFHFVLLLQEVHRVSSRLPVVGPGRTIPWRIEPTPPSGDRVDITEVAERCGLALVYVPSVRNGPTEAARSREDKGNAILSTLAVTELAAIELPFEADRKVAVAATISGPGGDRLRVTSVHLDLASTLARTLRTGNATRLRQGLGLTEALDAMESLPTVVGGDFNTWSAHESVMRRLAIEFPDSPAWDGQTTRGPFPTDHMLFRTSPGSAIQLVEGSYRKISERYGSDHAARILWLRGNDAGSLHHSDQVRQ